jgi:hypothetical protein
VNTTPQLSIQILPINSTKTNGCLHYNDNNPRKQLLQLPPQAPVLLTSSTQSDVVGALVFSPQGI